MKLINVTAFIAALCLLFSCDNANNQSAEAPDTPPKSPAITANATDTISLRTLTIATGAKNGVYEPIGSALANLFATTYGIEARAQLTGGSVENINLLLQKKAQLALVMGDTLNDALSGKGAFPQPVNNIEQIAALYDNYVQIVANPAAEIKTLADLKGKRVAVGDQNSGVESSSRSVLNSIGMTYDDIKVQYLGYTEAVNALLAGQLDAAFLTSALPNNVISALPPEFSAQLVPLSKESIEQLTQEKPYFVAASIPAKTYGNKQAIATVSVRNALIVHADLSADDAYQLTKTLFHQLKTLQTAHPAVADIPVKQNPELFFAPIHTGAKRYFDEINAKK